MKVMIVTVGINKGGVGRTTLAFRSALARASAGRDVLLMEGDRQGSAQTAVALRSEAGRHPALSCACYPNGAVQCAQVKLRAGKYKDVLMYAGGRDSSALRAALVLFDVLMVPVAPRTVDVWALGDIAELVDEARPSVRDGLRALAALNLADAGVSATTPTPSRRWPTAGRGSPTPSGSAVDELAPRDPNACEELTALSDRLFADCDAIRPPIRMR
jgi:chromosome partitioning protein